MQVDKPGDSYGWITILMKHRLLRGNDQRGPEPFSRMEAVQGVNLTRPNLLVCTITTQNPT